jgi:hypothetical protein
VELNIILIHIGDEFFEHINTHLEQLRKFNNCDIFLGISKKHHQHIRVTDVTLVDIDDIENIKELSPGDDHEIWGAASTTKLTIYCYA